MNITKSEMIVILCLLMSAAIWGQCETAKILALFPMPSKSHTIASSVLLKELARRGHEVTLITLFPTGEVIENYKEIHWNYEFNVDKGLTYWTDPKISTFTKWMDTFKFLPEFCECIHKSSNLRSFLDRKEKYDICIYVLTMSESFLGICDHVNATAIGYNTVGMSPFLAYASGNPRPYAYVPHLFLPFTSELTFFQRLMNTVAWLISDIYLEVFAKSFHSDILKRFYPGAPPLDQLIENVDLFLINSNYATDTLVPLLPNVIPIGGFHMHEKIAMDSDLKEFLDRSTKGVIYFNLGGNARGSNIDKQILRHILNTFAKLPYNILWKYEDELPDKPENVRIEKWLPQKPILLHHNLKLFMTHGGIGGMVEAIYAGVPMICMPHVGDQLKNCAESVANGYAISVNIATLDEEKLTQVINEILQNPQYKEKIMLKSDIYRNQEVNPMDRAIFWIEHVVKHKGAKHLKAGGRNIPWYQYLLLDVIAFVLLLLFLSVKIISFVLRLGYRLLIFILGKYTR